MRISAHLSTLVVLTILNLPSFGQAPRIMSFQGFLADSAGSPIDGQEDLTIRLFDAGKGGLEVWNRTYSNLPINDGVFNIEFNGGAPDFSSVPFDDSVWLQIEVNAQKLGSREPLTASAYTMGLSLPIEAHVQRNGPALKITNDEPLPSASGLVARGPTAVRGESSSSQGYGVHGVGGSGSDVTFGVAGETHSTSGRGVAGYALALTGGTWGVYGQSLSTSGIGVRGIANAATGSARGVVGLSFSTSGTAVDGIAGADSGSAVGVKGSTLSPTGLAGKFSGGRGVFVSGVDNAAPDLILGGSDDGRIFSDPDHASSDIWLHSNDAVVVQLDTDGSGEDADFEVRDSANVVVFDVDESGDVRVNGALVHSSDRDRKSNIEPVNTSEILEQVARLPVQRWRFNHDPAGHIGPMAQDFYAAFGLGSDDRHIATVDADGVALAAIQGLYELVMEQRTLIDGQQTEIDRLRQLVEAN